MYFNSSLNALPKLSFAVADPAAADPFRWHLTASLAIEFMHVVLRQPQGRQPKGDRPVVRKPRRPFTNHPRESGSVRGKIHLSQEAELPMTATTVWRASVFRATAIAEGVGTIGNRTQAEKFGIDPLFRLA